MSFRDSLFAPRTVALVGASGDAAKNTARPQRYLLLAATGGSPRHALILDHQLRPLFGFFSALMRALALLTPKRLLTPMVVMPALLVHYLRPRDLRTAAAALVAAAPRR